MAVKTNLDLANEAFTRLKGTSSGGYGVGQGGFAPGERDAIIAAGQASGLDSWMEGDTQYFGHRQQTAAPKVAAPSLGPLVADPSTGLATHQPQTPSTPAPTPAAPSAPAPAPMTAAPSPMASLRAAADPGAGWAAGASGSGAGPTAAGQRQVGSALSPTMQRILTNRSY